MARTQEWAKLDLGWYANRKVKRVTRRFGPVAGAYWAMLIALAKDASHHAVNPTGVFETCMQDLADNLHDRRHRVTLFEEFISAKLIRVSGSDWASDPEAPMTIELVDFGGHQNPKGSPADRQAKKRHLQESVTQSHIPSHSVTREEERREEKTTTPRAKEPTSSLETTVVNNSRSDAAISRERRKLGGLALTVDELATKYDERWNSSTMLVKIWKPCTALLEEHGDTVLGEALLLAISEPPAQPGAWLAAVCANKSERAGVERKAKAEVQESRIEKLNRIKREAGIEVEA